MLRLDMILGIDPGLANLGWAVIKEKEGAEEGYELTGCGVIKSSQKDRAEVRLGKIADELEEIIKNYQIEKVAFESLFFAKNVTSAIGVAEAIGVIKVTAYKMGLKVEGFTPLQVKMTLVGYGRAEKEQVEEMVRRELNMEEKIRPSHASDAVAVALCEAISVRGKMNYDL